MGESAPTPLLVTGFSIRTKGLSPVPEMAHKGIDKHRAPPPVWLPGITMVLNFLQKKKKISKRGTVRWLSRSGYLPPSLMARVQFLGPDSVRLSLHLHMNARHMHAYSYMLRAPPPIHTHTQRW